MAAFLAVPANAGVPLGAAVKGISQLQATAPVVAERSWYFDSMARLSLASGVVASVAALSGAKQQQRRRSGRAHAVMCRAAPSREDVNAAQKEADLHIWAANTLAAEGNPQAAAMKAKADQKVQTFQTLKAMLDGAGGAPAMAGAAPAAAPAYSAPMGVATGAAPTNTMGMSGGPSKEEVEKAQKDADLFAWAAKTLAADGNPKAASMQAEADQKAQKYTALKAQLDAAQSGVAFAAAPVAATSAPAAAPYVAPTKPVRAAGGGAPSKEEVEAAKADADLYAWSASTLAAEGNPKAAEMQAKAAQKMQAYEALRAMLDQAQMAF